MSRDSVGHTLLVAGVLCVVCSLLVSAAAVGLRPRQQENKERERQRNILKLTGLLRDDTSIEQAFRRIETRVVELDTGRFVPSSEIDPETFDQRSAAGDERLGEPIPPDEDVAGLGRREKYSLVYFVKSEGEVDQIVLPVYGKGLWSTMYGFLSLDRDKRTIRGLSFYEHGETPGLGGEVDNPKWRSQWVGKKAYDEEGDLRIRVIKGTVDPDDPTAEYEVDGLSGATITSDGVTDMLEYWLGDDGFGPMLEKLDLEREGGDA